MAGSYPDMPSRKMAWDEDGTVVFGAAPESPATSVRGELPIGVQFSELSLADKQDINADSDGTWGSATVGPANDPGPYLYLFFPEKREIDGYYWNMYWQDGSVDHEFLSISKTTTNGLDGSWSALGSEVLRPINTSVVPDDYRDFITSSAESNVTAIYSQGHRNTGVANRTQYIRALHVYGSITPSENPDILLYLDVDNADVQFTKPLDYGDIGRGSASIKRIKVKNNSASRSASDIDITSEALIAGEDMFKYSTDSVNGVVTKALGALGPGATKDVYVHLNVSDSYVVGLYEPRTVLTVGSWT